MSIDYKNKYLKYKNKYFLLKNQVGGDVYYTLKMHEFSRVYPDQKLVRYQERDFHDKEWKLFEDDDRARHDDRAQNYYRAQNYIQAIKNAISHYTEQKKRSCYTYDSNSYKFSLIPAGQTYFTVVKYDENNNLSGQFSFVRVVNVRYSIIKLKFEKELIGYNPPTKIMAGSIVPYDNIKKEPAIGSRGELALVNSFIPNINDTQKIKNIETVLKDETKTGYKEFEPQIIFEEFKNI